VANSQDDAHPDLLAAVVLHTLVSEGRDGMSFVHMAIACERDPNVSADVKEIEVALQILLADDLALHEDGLYRPTRAAIRAAELSF
jgi:hypothetical protein